jgi:alkylated DNA repair dioxygenase AlkB
MPSQQILSKTQPPFVFGQKKPKQLPVWRSLWSIRDNFHITYIENMFNKRAADKYFQLLESNLKYNTAEESKIFIAGQYRYIPRQQVAYGDPNTYYNFSGIKVNAKSWNDENDIVGITIKEIKSIVEIATGKKSNFVLINRYENGEDYIGPHHDDVRDLELNPSIIGVSFGAERRFCFDAKYPLLLQKLKDKMDIILGHGSCIVMHDPLNSHWKHSLPKMASIKTPRISLTFRQMVV